MKIRFFGQFLLAEGLVTAAQLVAAVEHQQAHNAPLGDYAIRLGFLTLEEVLKVNAQQASTDLFFGEAALKLGLLSEEQLERMVAEQKNEHIRIGEALVALGYLEQAKLDEALERYKRQQAEWSAYADELPEELPMRALISRAFTITERLLLRRWGLQCKPEPPKVVEAELRLSDINAEIGIESEEPLRYVLAVPTDAATAGVHRITGSEEVSRAERKDAALELSNVVAGKLVGVLAEQGASADITLPRAVSFRYPLDGAKAVVCPLASHHGLLFTALVFDSR